MPLPGSTHKPGASQNGQHAAALAERPEPASCCFVGEVRPGRSPVGRSRWNGHRRGAISSSQLATAGIFVRATRRVKAPRAGSRDVSPSRQQPPVAGHRRPRRRGANSGPREPVRFTYGPDNLILITRADTSESPEVVTSFRLHRRQFWIGPASEAPSLGGWVHRSLPQGRCLVHDPDLRVAEARAQDGSAWWLLGLAVQTDQTRAEPTEEIRGAPTGSAVVACTPTWVGRWVLIGSDVLYTDASALLSCYYRPAHLADGVCVSSSAALLIAPIAPTVSAATNPPITYRVGMDWYPMPWARHVALARLLPSQGLRLSDGALSPRALVVFPERPLSYETLLEQLAAYLTNAIRRAAEAARGAVLVSLTSGYDSRLVLAAAVRAGGPADVYLHVADHAGVRPHPAARAGGSREGASQVGSLGSAWRRRP